MAGWHTVTDDARTALTDHTTFDGHTATIVDQLGPDTWYLTKMVLQKAGAVFVPGTSRFEFDDDVDAAQLVADVLTAGRVMSAATSHGWVPTPAGLAAELVSLHAEIGGRPYRDRSGPLQVLDPSAGEGGLLRAVLGDLADSDRCDRLCSWIHATAVEIEPRRARRIPAGPVVDVVVDAFETVAAGWATTGRRFDRIVMNPPFSVPGRSSIWAEHLLLAWQLLEEGGRLMAIVPSAVLYPFPSSRARRDVAALIAEHGRAEDLGVDAFEEVGVKVGTAVVWLDRPVGGPQPQPAGPGHVFRAYTGAEVPVLVDRPLMTRGAAKAMPVQRWWDSWRARNRVLRYRAECAACQTPVWAFDDGENDPRGVLGDQSAAWSLDPAEHGRVGMPVGLCALCGNDSRAEARGLVVAEREWAAAADRLAAPVVVPVAAPVVRVPEPRRPVAVEQLSLF